VPGDLRIGVLGPLEVRAGPGLPVVEVAGPRLRRLLLRLALDPGRVVTTGQLVDAVWDRDPPAGAANALQALVSRLRRLLPDAVGSSPAGYRLAVPAEAVDAVRFEALAQAGRERLGGDPGRARELLGEALELWRGPAMADAATAAFAGPAVARLEDLRLAALEDRVEADLAFGAGDRLVAELEELVAAHPLRERLGGQLLRALAMAGRQADALGAYERLRARLADELGIDPSPELQALHVAVLRGELTPKGPATTPGTGPPAPAAGTAGPDPTAPAPRTNLRSPITSFVGRGDDLTRITGAFATARLVTLIRPGGAGKTRLAAEAAGRLLDRMPNGVWLVELASVAAPVDLPQAVLSLLGARELRLLATPGTTAIAPLDRLVEAIGNRRMLLVADNCEHLVEAAAKLVDHLLARCPGLSVLATSREPLGIAGEVLHPVGPLAVPDGEVAPAAALAYPAVRLLADRGAAARPGFTVDAATVGPVLRICRALDGMPLAIELAAARLHALAPTQIAARLDDRFRLLADGRRTAGGRHQTLRAVIYWSWELLGQAEQVLLRRLSVFAGGATQEAAERVCAGPGPAGPAADEVLYLLAGLVAKSLVVAADGDGAGVRYRMLETVRAYGAERLAEAGEDQALARAHAAWFLELAEAAEPELRRRDQLRWLDRLAAERDNLHAALRWATDSGDADTALRLAAALGWYWTLTSARTEGLEWSAKTLTLPGGDPATRAQVLAFRALTVLSGGIDLEPALAMGAEAMTALDALPADDPRRSHPVLTILPALLAMFGNDDQTALARLAADHDHPDPWMAATAHLLTGVLQVNLGEAAAAERAFATALARFDALGERWGAGQAMIARADLAATRGQHEQAMAALEDAMEALAGLGDREDVGQVLIRRAGERARAGQVAEAEADLDAADRLAHEVGAEDQKLYVRLTRADLARWRGRLDEARALLDGALAEYRRGGFPVEQVHAVALVALGLIEVAAGDLAAARECYDQGLRAAVATRDRPVIARVTVLGAAVALAAGDPRRRPGVRPGPPARGRAAPRGGAGRSGRRGQLRRRNARRASGAATAAIAADQARAPRAGAATSPPTSRPRTASTSRVAGLTATQACIQPGMVATGTKALEAKVRGNTTTNPSIITFSGSSTSMATSTGSHEKAQATATSRATAASTLTRLVWTRKPSRVPTPSRMAIDQTWRTTSAAIRPARGAERAMGRLRKRSKTPLVMSVLRATPVFMVRNRAFWVMMPARPNCRKALGEPEMAPPNTNANRATNISGCRLRSASSMGLWRIWTRLRQARVRVWRTASSGPTRSWRTGAGVPAAGWVMVVVMPRSDRRRRSGGR
jgi:predicted ATPase/DNA-binding SARP family transcriptional activator